MSATSANSFSEVVDQGSYSQTGDIYSQGMTGKAVLGLAIPTARA